MATVAAGYGFLPSASLEPYGQQILKYGIGQLGTPIDVGQLTAKVAGPTAFQQASQQRTADMYGMGDIQRDASGMVTGFAGKTGIASYQPYLDAIGAPSATSQDLLSTDAYKQFMSPYQQEVIDATMTDFDVQAGLGRKQIREQQAGAGAFGGARAGIQSAEYQAASDRNRAALLAGLRGQGYQQALDQQKTALAQLQGMGTYATGLEQQGIASLGALGAENRELEQMKLNQLTAGQQQAYQLPLKRIQDVANLYGSVAGAMPGSPTMPFQPSPMVTGIGGVLGAANIMGMFGQQNTQQGQQNTNPTNYTGALNQDFWRTNQYTQSDIRLKENVELIGKSPSNINIYKFNYKGKDTVYEGVMAQEVPWASIEDQDGYLMVDYSKVDVDFKKI